MPEVRSRLLTQAWFGGLFSTSAFLLASRLLGAGAGFVMQVILARFLAPADLGVYFIATSVVVIGGVLAAHGYPSIAVRFVSRYRADHGAPFQARFVRHAERETLILAVALATAVAVGAAAWPGIDQPTRSAFFLAAAMIPFVAAFRLYGSLAIAVRAFRLAYLPDVSLKPMTLLAVLAIIILLQKSVDLVEVMLALTVITMVLSIAQRQLLARSFLSGLRPARAAGSAGGRSVVSRWRREAHAVLLVAIFAQFLPELSIVIATPVLSPAEIGVFGLCLKLAFLVGFFVLVTQNIAMPDLAETLGKGGDRRAASQLAASGLAATAFSLAATLGCVLWGGEVLRIFGPDFAAGHAALVMLVITQLVRAAFGPANAVLTLVGAQRLNLLATVVSLGFLVLGTLSLGMLFGPNGAAAALLGTVLFWSLLSAVMLQRTAGIRVDLLSAVVAWRAETAGQKSHSPGPPAAEVSAATAG